LIILGLKKLKISIDDIGFIIDHKNTVILHLSFCLCVSCHNAWEKRASIKKSRSAAGVAPGKKFKLNELMGAVVVNVALD